jgi:heme oxygenase
MSALAGLRAATWPSHQRLEKRLDIKARFTEPSAYRAHLERMWGFCAALERRLDAATFGAALEDYPARRKLPLLTRDLVALGAEPEAVERLPCCEALPACEDTASAFGCAYVLEGATLGGRTLLPLVETRLGLNAAGGASFLASYGEDVQHMWRTFGSALEAWCDGPERRERAAGAAVATFDALERWLVGAHA